MELVNRLLKRKYFRYFSVSFAGTIFVVIFAMGGSILTARFLGPEGKGMYTLLYSTVIMSISMLGLKLDFSQAYVRKNAGFSEIVSATVIISLISGLLAACISSAILYAVYDSVYKGVPVNLAIYAVSLVPALLMAQNLRAAINADYDVPSATVVQTSRTGFFFFGFLAIAAVGLTSLETAVFTVGFSIYSMLLLALIITRKKINTADMASRELFWMIVRFALKTHIGQLFKYMQYRFDVFLIAFFLTPAEVGIYSIAVVIAELLWKIPNVASGVLLPKLARGNNRRSALVSARLNRIIFAFTAICMLPLIFWSDSLISLLFGDEYIDGHKVVTVLLPGILALTVFKILTPDLIMQGRAWTFSGSVLASVFVMISMDVYLIPSIGIVGAGIASSISYMVAALIVFITVYRTNDLPFMEYFNILKDFNAFVKYRAQGI